MASIRRLSFFFWGPALLVLGLAFWLRSESAQLRQFHADEGVQAYQAWKLIETGEYRYDAAEHHGPVLYYFTKWAYPLLSDGQGELTDFRMRLVPLAFSLGSLVLGYVLLRPYGQVKALIWGLLFAVSPLCVIYGAYFVQEALLGCFTLGFALCLFRYLESPNTARAIGAGLFLGLMHVTKETTVIHLFAIGCAAVFCFSVKLLPMRRGHRGYLREFAWAASLIVLLHILFFSSFFQHPEGIWDGVKTYFSYANRAGGEGHEKAWNYYLHIFRPHSDGGLPWGELGFGLAAMVSVGYYTFGRKSALPVFMSVTALVMLVVYTMIPYKTPWLLYTVCMLVSYPVASFVCDAFLANRQEIAVLRWGYAAAFFLFLGWWGATSFANLRNAVFRYPSDERNPYLYVHTTPRYQKLLERLESVDESIPIEVYSPEAAWPLPWHLRERANVGYWNGFNEREPNWESIVVADTRLLEGSDFLSSGGFWELHGLRPNTLLALRVPEEVAEKWIQR